MRRITSLAAAWPQCLATISNSGFGRGAGLAAQREDELCRLMTATAEVFNVVLSDVTPSKIDDVPCCGNPECR